MSRIRKGMWVRHGTRVGIAAEVGETEAQFHEVDANGETVRVDVVFLSAITQAAFDDIPDARKPTEEMARSLGYL